MGIRRGQSFWWAFGAGFRVPHSILCVALLTLLFFHIRCTLGAVLSPTLHPHSLSLIHRFFPRVNVNKTLFDQNLRGHA